MRPRKFTIGWGPREKATRYVDLAFTTYSENGNPASLIITKFSAASHSVAGFASMIAIQKDDRPGMTPLTFHYQVGEMFGFLASFMTILDQDDADYLGLLFVNHTKRADQFPEPERGMEEIASAYEGIHKICTRISSSLTAQVFQARTCDWVYLEAEATI
ncbi:hypothetical protein GobsT_49990 [Gemmata obscuriglobus]|uniref:Uncharacterized protein n=1 Tax=Gemmata obscuriglobus TaxID=114 RepID=A0A2Z3GTI4_9BACT|nr:hypothetical protein [Gemmata obscuriglobus]AWM37083.1 hypothetical protein C1280_08635 [Gemmata obscuriglobus]QEG30196.1 hypothetical protein GobsT_49990 [Gemmata obscuriglobus]VTS09520.1 unnamed protein product [Gemmata obscuriglobus UQM 2246]